jgi:hypothetical protein
MKAKEARAIANSYIEKVVDVREVAIQNAVDKILKDVEKYAHQGQTSMLFAPGLRYSCDDGTVKTRLEKMGYYFVTESDMGMKYEMICW